MATESKHNEATRVQLPALVHLTRIGYKYFGKINEDGINSVYDPETNILIKVFEEQFKKLNPNHEGEAVQMLQAISQELDNDDLGRSFYKRLTSVSPVRLIDFENPNNNVYHCTAEFTCKNGDDEFRPDITLFVNGLPLVFIEVKKPNNEGGMLAESNRMNKKRFPVRKLRRFINVTQLMIFSNNMEYDSEGGIVPIQGVFYCTGARQSAQFNCFREENPQNSEVAPYNRDYPYKSIDPIIEKRILTDFNCQVIHTSPEYQTNLNTNTPTNRALTSLCSPERLLFILKYGIAYVKMQKEEDGKIKSVDQKHIMRYQQMFAALAIKEKIAAGKKSGVVWHTQGSGKTALSYFLTNVLSDYFATVNKVPKYYFIVDRLDLLDQASQEFEARGLEVKTANSRRELMAQFKTNQSTEGHSGKPEITVVNIQRFAEDKDKVTLPPYATNLQRVFIVDEAHRGYNPAGSFLANLFNADENSIKIALTGTPLLKKERESWKIFGEYFHVYYYDKAVQDGYTLKIIREDIETTYKESLSKIYEKLEKLVSKKEVTKSDIVENDNYVKELLRFIITDINNFRRNQGDDTLGAMIVCETSGQARKLSQYFNDIQNELNESKLQQSHLKAGLILHDSDDEKTRKQTVSNFKKNFTVDVLIVYNMLLTGFDAPRLKRLYLGRKLKDHTLLQAITRVNRPYKNQRYGYVVDFADIKRNFDETNEAYMQELNRFNNPQETLFDITTKVIVEPDEMIEKMKQAKQVLFDYTTDNLEEFCSEISAIEDKEQLLKLRKALENAKACINIVKTFGDDELKETFAKLEIAGLPEMLKEVQRHIDIVNQKQAFAVPNSTIQLVSLAMENITFRFNFVGKDELLMKAGAVELQEKWSKAINGFVKVQNMDSDDPQLITLREAFLNRFKEHGFVVNTLKEFNSHSRYIDDVIKKLNEMQRRNKVLARKYNDDYKFLRVHKRISEENKKRKTPMVSMYEGEILSFLLTVKNNVDKKVYDKNDILKKDAYFEQTVMKEITDSLNAAGIVNERDDRIFIRNNIARQYIDQYNDTYPAA